MTKLKIKLLRPNAKMPTRAYATDSGADCYAAIDAPVMIGQQSAGKALEEWSCE